MALRALRGKGDQIVDVQEAAPREALTDSESRDGDDAPVFLQTCEAIARSLLTPDAREETFRLDVRAKLAHDGMAGDDLGVGRCDANAHASPPAAHASIACAALRRVQFGSLAKAVVPGGSRTQECRRQS